MTSKQKNRKRGEVMDLRELSKPFDPSEIEWFIGVTTQDKSKGLAIPYISNRAVQIRLDEVCGIDGWKNSYETMKESDTYDRNGTITGKKTSYLCGISIWSEARGEWITKWDGSDGTDIEELKGGLSSAMKRSATQWGIGRYLYYLESPWVEIEPKGKSYVIKAGQQLSLPDWAIPGGKGFPLATDSRQVRVGHQNVQSTSQTPAQPSKASLSDKQVNRALAKATAAGMGKEDVVLWIEKKFGISEIKNLSRGQYDDLCDALDRARN